MGNVRNHPKFFHAFHKFNSSFGETVPAVGENFEEIFEEIVKINTLDYKLYEGIQQKIIDALDKGYAAHIVGCGDNVTDLTVQLYPLMNPE